MRFARRIFIQEKGRAGLIRHAPMDFVPWVKDRNGAVACFDFGRVGNGIVGFFDGDMIRVWGQAVMGGAVERGEFFEVWQCAFFFEYMCQ